jgi:hypothetical protein
MPLKAWENHDLHNQYNPNNLYSFRAATHPRT